ncbi:hypothetical protein HBF26_14730 [Luteibacter jiangsuensis]|uniref:Uncharacterized protein n=1 Tax=Luteibacter jiangsuensis TaxID=637577 RepID=A0ABX0Q716_9GAMM|nr:hypothetical protein [Luteibacter jiangsuensis]NID06146.1 hypothetical protein [Luteibacter jiangsuensis]
MTNDEREKIRSNINALMAETMKISAEGRWYPFVATGGVFLAALGFCKLLSVL